MDPEIHTEVPPTLKRLVRYIVRGFYTIEHAIIIDLLVHHPCIKEDDMIELLKFERKQLRALINSLKTDKFLKVRMRLETDGDGRTTRHNYYFINYSTFVNVVKYKLDIMRRKIETEERDSTSRASFKCPQCVKTFTDLEADQLFDPMEGKFLCTYCHTEVEEEETAQPKTDARTLMVKFNEQISPIFALLREVEDIKLAPSVLEPEPVDLKNLYSSKTSGGSSSRSGGLKWSGEATKGVGFGVTENTVTVAMENEGETVKPEKRPVKERPVWMVESTVQGAFSDPFMQAQDQARATVTTDARATSSKESDDIMRTLLAHEKKGPTPILPATGVPPSDDETSTSESEDEAAKPKPKPPSTVPVGLGIGGAVEIMESDDDDDSVPLVTIGNAKVPYNEVTEEMVEKMTPAEKDIYIQLGQEMYENMYD